MARRFGRFNPNQKRDKNGRWTRGGGSSGSKRKRLTKTQRENRKRVRTGAVIGGALGFFSTLGTPIGAVTGAAIGGALVARKNRKGRR